MDEDEREPEEKESSVKPSQETVQAASTADSKTSFRSRISVASSQISLVSQATMLDKPGKLDFAFESGAEQETDDEEEPAPRFYDLSALRKPPQTSSVYPYSQPPIELIYSFGYDCEKRGNLLMITKSTLAYAAGNFVHFLNIETKVISFLPTVDGFGIGHICLHPKRKCFVVAETGDPPNIYIYDFPRLRLWKILRDGAECSYAVVTFNLAGDLLASVATEPDYMLTIWNWRKEVIVLRTKAFFNDVYTIAFSPFTPGLLTSGGIGHIKFWKMAKTFTGLKLQGALGRFGRMEVSNIEGLIQLPDGKVLTGSEWGNMLLWEGGLIKVEITRRMGKSCHLSSISQFLLEEGEILSVGGDGDIKVWQMEILDGADIMNEQGTFETEPLNETKVSEDAFLLYVVKSLNPNSPHEWFSQDRNGGVWCLDLSFSYTSKQPEKVLSCHRGKITGMDVSPTSHLLATTGVDGTVRLYDIVAKKQLCEVQLSCPGSSILWIPKVLVPKCNLIAVGFTDGSIRIFIVEPSFSVYNDPIVQLVLKQWKKPHRDKINCISCIVENKLVITGSSDEKVFFLAWNNERLVPLGFINIYAEISWICTSPTKSGPQLILVTCTNGEIFSFQAPDTNKKVISAAAKKKSYLMDSDCLISKMSFTSVKSKFKLLEEKTQKNVNDLLQQALKESDLRRLLRKPKKDVNVLDLLLSQYVDVDELATTVFEVPAVPSPILFGYFDAKLPQMLWLSMGGYDSGYLYQYELQTVAPDDDWDAAESMFTINTEPNAVFTLENSNDAAVHSLTFSLNGNHVAIGFANGIIRIAHLPSPYALLSNEVYWEKRIHDSYTGIVSHLKFSYDERYLISGGADGSVFCFAFRRDRPRSKEEARRSAEIPESSMTRDEIKAASNYDVVDRDHPSLEQEKQLAEHYKLMKMVEKKKHALHQNLRHLHAQFVDILVENYVLPKKLQLTYDELIISQNLRKELLMQFQNSKHLTVLELAWEYEKGQLALKKLHNRFKEPVLYEALHVKAFSTSFVVTSYRLANLTNELQQLLATEDEEELKSQKGVRKSQVSAIEQSLQTDERRDEEHLSKTPVSPVQLVGRIFRQLQAMEVKKRQKLLRKAQWDALMARKPTENKNDPAILKAIETTKDNIGDFNLKSAPDYVVPEHLRMTTKKKLKELVQCIHLAYLYKKDFNHKVCYIREKKLKMIHRFGLINDRLKSIQTTMKSASRKPLPPIPTMEPFEMPQKQLKNAVNKLSQTQPNVPIELLQTKSSTIYSQLALPSSVLCKPSEVEVKLDRFVTLEEEIPLGPHATFTPLEEAIYQMKLKRHLYEQDMILKEVVHGKEECDRQVMQLLRERRRLDITLKIGEMRQLFLYSELKMLRQFEAQENDLLTKLENKVEEKTDMESKIEDFQMRVDTKRKEIEHLHEQEKFLQQELNAVLSEHLKFAQLLTRIFRKRIKRAKATEVKKADDDEESEEESSESESDLDLNLEEEDEDEFVNDSVCPEGCDPALFVMVLNFREKRLDIEDMLQDEKKQIENFKKEIDAIAKRLKNVDSTLKQVQAEFKKVQQEKQNCLNEILAVIPLKLNQIEFLDDDGEIPKDINNCLVFPDNGLKTLEQRIHELSADRVIQRQHSIKNQQHYRTLIKECKLMDDKIMHLERKCEELMIEKFGCIVDMNTMDNIYFNKAVEEMKQNLQTQHEKFYRERLQWKKLIGAAQENLMHKMVDNTQRLLGVNEIITERKHLEHKMRIRRKNLPRNLLPEKLPGELYEQSLKRIVCQQADEITLLKEQLAIYESKSGMPDSCLQVMG